MSLRTRIFVLILAALLPAMVACVFIEIKHRHAREDDLRRDAQQDAVLIAIELSRLINGIEHTLKAISRMPSVRAADGEACSRYVTDLKVSFNGPSEIGVADLSGQVICLSRPIRGINVSDRPYFQRTVASRSMGVGEFAVGRAAGARAIHFGYPVEDMENRLFGIAFMPLNLTWLSDTLARLPLPPGASVTVADRKGTVLVQLPERKLVGEQLPQDWKALLHTPAPDTVPLPGLVDATANVVGYVPLGQGPDGLFVAVGLSRDFGMQPIDNATVQAIALVTLSLALAFGLAWFIGQYWMHRPLQDLTDAARRLKRGDYATRVQVLPRGAPELSSLSEAVNQVAQTLQSKQTEVEQREEDLRKARDQAEAASRSKTSFLAAVSHDLRQPLHSMSMTTALLGVRLAGRPEIAVVSRLQRSVTDLSELLNAVLDVSQLDAGLIEPQLDDFSVATLFQAASDHFSVEATMKGVSFEVQPTKVWIRSDPRLLRRIVENLVSNAIKYTPKGGHVRLTSSDAADSVQIRVEDNGPGIPADKQAEVWEEFRQLGNSERDAKKGLGLGLAIVQRMASLLQHQLTLHSSAQGTTFTVTVPRSVRQETFSVPSATPVLSGTVLVVEDDQEVAASTAEMMEAWGCTVLVCSTAEGAISLLQDETARIDAVVTDYRLPGQSGTNLIRYARSLSVPPVCIMVTGDIEGTVEREIASDVLVLSKPVDARTLATTLAFLAPEQVDREAGARKEPRGVPSRD